MKEKRDNEIYRRMFDRRSEMHEPTIKWGKEKRVIGSYAQLKLGNVYGVEN